MYETYLSVVSKKRILFLISSLESGGVSKSMVSLLNSIDCQKYEVVLWTASPNGLFSSQVPHDVEILSDDRIEALGLGFKGLFILLKKGCLWLMLGSVLRIVLSKFSKSLTGRLLAQMMPVIRDERYDLIVDFNGQHQLYYMVNKLRGEKKVTFFHSDYSQWPYYYQADKKYYPSVDAIFTISPHCVEVMKAWFPDQADKIHLMENITSPLLINKLADATFDNPWRQEAVRLVTVGHLTDTKGTHWAIEAAHILKGRGIDIQWVFVGAMGSNGSRYNKMIQQWNLQDDILFVGTMPNPYPYMKYADIFVHPSQFEGKSIALDEAKLLCKPIVVTNFSTVHDQFENGENAIICEMSPLSIADAIENLIKNKEMRESFIDYLRKHQVDNTSEINKIYQLLN